jgi:hypothetical protein
MKTGTKALLSSMLGAVTLGSANAAEVLVTQDIATSTTWTADNTYNLQAQIYVLPGATLTIEPGTVIASTPSSNGSGSLAITRGAKIMAMGTAENPIIFTSTNDDFTTWREAANEWGNITIMGNAYISENATPGNTPVPSASNVANMEGLVAQFPGDPNVQYGGGDDDDDSGVLNYVSLRYGGRVVGLTNELNGLSLGGIGRGTEISHVEIMNNVDDGIEIWGGTVNLSHFSIWNIGDDSLDIDQGYRGKIQYGFIVQGHSLDASQGSGVGDNAIEVDGAEDSDWQPVTTTTMYNMTVIGQPVDGDGLTAWRDNARVQYRQSIFMDGGEALVRPDGDDGDGAQGYGFNGTLTFAETWQTDASVFSDVNAPKNPEDFYRTQTDGKLAEIVDSVFFRNLADSAYTEADARGVLAAANDNVITPGFDDADAPIVSLVRQVADADGDGLPGVTRGGRIMLRVLSVDPRPANDAVTAVRTAPNDGFFCPRDYRGAFGPNENWLADWSAADSYGFLAIPSGVLRGTEPCDVAAPCPTDLDGSGSTDFSDLLTVLAAFNQTADGDVNGDGVTDFADLLDTLAGFGPCP